MSASPRMISLHTSKNYTTIHYFGGDDDTAEAKKRIMRECGIHVVESPAEIGKKVVSVLSM